MRRLAVAAAGIALVCSGCATGFAGDPSFVSKTGATIPGQVTSNGGGSVEYWVQYGTGTSYGSQSGHQTVTAPQNTLVAVTVPLSGLQGSTTYHYRLCAQDGQQQGGPGCSADRTLTTQAVDCSETVTTDVKLNGNLLCPQETGLVVGADGIDIDLNGYTIDGGISVGGGGPPGIDNSAGHGDLTIRNGTLQGFGIPVSIVGASHNRVLDITSSGANTAVKIQGGSDNEIRRNDAFGRSWGITVEDSDHVVVADTRVSAGFSWGMAVSGDYARIVRNHAVDQGESPGNDNGIALIGAHGRVAGNRVEGPWTLGALEIFGPDNRVVDNVVTGAALPIGPVPSEAIGDGIVVLTDSQGTVLRRNRADDNAGDGIQTMSAGVRLGDNTANDNGDFGIDAAAGSTDLGGNTATGNGNPLQCRNVFCP